MNIKKIFSRQETGAGVSFRRNAGAPVARLLILLCAISCFTYFNAARVIIYISAVLFMLMPGTRDKIFVHRGSFIVLIFTVIGIIVGLIYGNILGALFSLSFFAMMVVTFVCRSIATKSFYERLLDTIILGGCLATFGAIIERIVNFNVPSYRCTVLYPNPNFFGLGVTLAVMICAYKAVNRAKNTWVYYLAAVFNAVGILLCGSMSLLPVAALCIVILLTISRRYELLAIFVGIGILAIITVILIPQFLPRINEMGDTTDNRITIWNFAIKHIKEAPVFGRGFFSYKHLYNLLSPSDPTIYKASLCHNIIIDSMLCHGIVGTALILLYIVQYTRDVFACRKALILKNEDYIIIKFIVSVAAAIFCYGMIDTTMVWVQTGMIILFISAGLGVGERKVKHIQ